MASKPATPSEEEPGQKWDRCVADVILKTGVGFALGGFFSLLVFKKRWPMVLGTGFGLGFAISNCQHEFKRVDSLYIRPVKVEVHKQVNNSEESSTSDKPS